MIKTTLVVCFLAHVAAAACPTAVSAAIEKRFPKSTVQTCKPEHDQFEVKLTKADGGKVEADVTNAGDITQVEEPIAVDQVPKSVMTAFAAKYPKAKPAKAEKQTPAKGKVSYEIAFDLDGKHKEATFAEDGAFVEEE
ncbi:MAG: hypothetical protein QM831_02775 [Kofleriaceae bacterium]